MPIATPQGTLDFKSVDTVTFVGASSNTVIDTTTGSLGVGVDGNGPTSNLHVVGNTRLEGDINMLHTSNTASIKLNSNVVTEFPRSKKLIKYPRVALTSAAGESSGYQSFYVTESSNSANTARHSWKAFNMTFDNTTSDNAWANDQTTTTYSGTDNAYNGSINLGTGAVNGEWIKLQLPHKIKLEYMKIWLKDNDPTRIPEDWILYGSDDNLNWTELFSKTGQGAINENLYNVNANSMYNYLAVVVTKISGQNNYFRIVELEYFGTPEYDPEADGVDVTVKSIPNVPNTDWLEVYYDGQDYTSTPTSITDKSGNDITATANNITIDATYNSFEFTQSPKSNIIAENVTFVSGDEQHSIALWVRLKNGNANNLLFDYRVAGGTSTTGAATGLYILSSNTRLQFFHQGTDKVIDFNFVQNRWYHIVGTYRGGGGFTGSKIYIDGVDVGGVLGGTDSVLVLPATGTITIGDFLYNSTYGLGDGSIANFRLFNRALTQDEIYQLYAYQKEYFGHGVLGMTLKAGRLGIGTSEPRAALDVRGGNISGYTVPYAIGGDVVNYGKYKVHIFKSSGTFTVKRTGTFEVLIVAGGGGGGRHYGGGGGAGGLINSCHIFDTGDYVVTIGGGGSVNTRGINSSIISNDTRLIAFGGGCGGNYTGYPSDNMDGGSGGGGGSPSNAQQGNFDWRIMPGGNSTSGQGSNGGLGFHSSGVDAAGGGGGGAGNPGKRAVGGTTPGNGGTGKSFNFYSNDLVYYAGGGGGGEGVSQFGTGGAGGGGNGAGGNDSTGTLSTAGAINTGGGGGGGGSNSGAGGSSGGSGIVLIRYLT